MPSGICAISLAGCTASSGLDIVPGAERLEPSRRAGPSPIFDGKRVALRGARGETLGLQVRVSDGRSRSARLEVAPEAARVQGFSVDALEVREPSTDMYGSSSGPGRYPDVLVPEPGEIRTDGVAYFDVAIRADAEPGRYRGALSIDGREIPVKLEVSKARIDVSQAPLVWVFYLPREIARAHGLPDDDGPASIATEREYNQLFRDHGALLASDLPPSRFEARRQFVHDVAYWPVAVDTSSDAAIERDTRAWIAIFAGSKVTPFAIPVDEPRDTEARLRARHIAEVIGRAGGGVPRLLRAVTDIPRPEYDGEIDVYISPHAIPKMRAQRLGRGERFWTYNGRPPEAGSMTLDTHSGGLRTWGWIAERYDVPLWYAWEGLYFSDRYNGGGPTDVLRHAITFDERKRGGSDYGNGDGVLAYPGPLPSMRLKALRRGLQDRLLLEQLRACGGIDTAMQITRTIVPQALGEAKGRPSWPENEAAWSRAHDAVLDAIEARCHASS